MYFATIDCGTTNSRVYVLDERLRVAAKGAKKVGVRDTAITGSRRTLQEGLKELFEETVREAGLRVQEEPARGGRDTEEDLHEAGHDERP